MSFLLFFFKEVDNTSKKERVFPIDTTGGRIQKLRIEYGYSREQLHDKILPELSSITKDGKYKKILNWESNQNKPDYEILCCICDLFKCDSDYLLCRQDTPSKFYSHFAEETGLSYDAVETLIAPNKNGHYYGVLLSDLLEHEDLLAQIALCCNTDYSKIAHFSMFHTLVSGESNRLICRPDYVRQSNEIALYRSLCDFIEDYRKKHDFEK